MTKMYQLRDRFGAMGGACGTNVGRCWVQHDHVLRPGKVGASCAPKKNNTSLVNVIFPRRPTVVLRVQQLPPLFLVASLSNPCRPLVSTVTYSVSAGSFHFALVHKCLLSVLRTHVLFHHVLCVSLRGSSDISRCGC